MLGNFPGLILVHVYWPWQLVSQGLDYGVALWQTEQLLECSLSGTDLIGINYSAVNPGCLFTNDHARGNCF